MRQLLYDMLTGEPRLEEVPDPVACPGRLVVRSRRSLVSVGTERNMLEYAQSSLVTKAKRNPTQVKQVVDRIRGDGLLQTVEAVLTRLGELKALGYCNVGTVAAVGAGVTGFQVGDRVVSNGPHAELALVSPKLSAQIPDQVSDDAAAFAVLGSIGLQGIRLVAPSFGERVVVIGLGVIGLLTAQLLQANGCQVLCLDTKADRLDLAHGLGLEALNSAEADPLEAARARSAGVGVDAVIITASSPTNVIIQQAAAMCRKRGRIVLVGVVGLELDRTAFYAKELTFQVSCSYGPGRYDPAYEDAGHDYPLGYVRWTVQRNFEAVLQAMQAGKLETTRLIQRRAAFSSSAEVYRQLVESGEALGVLFEYDETPSAARVVCASPDRTRQALAASSGMVAVIGAGAYATSTLGGALRSAGARVKSVADLDGSKALFLARLLGAHEATADYTKILEDAAADTVFILVRHDLHAKLVQECLAAGKHTFVEKPLALSVEELEAVMRAKLERPDRLLMVGFNRRFSSHVQRCLALLASRHEPLAMSMVINAGSIPADAWVHDPTVGGGRIIGEGCHFIDLMAYLAGAPVTSVAAAQQHGVWRGPEDRVAMTLRFADGSVGSLAYFSNGPRGYPKEVLEVFCEGKALRLEDFRETRGWGWLGFNRFKSRGQDKGHREECRRVLERVRAGGDTLIPLAELVNVTLASFAAVRSAREGRTIVLETEYPELCRLLEGSR